MTNMAMMSLMHIPLTVAQGRAVPPHIMVLFTLAEVEEDATAMILSTLIHQRPQVWAARQVEAVEHELTAESVGVKFTANLPAAHRVLAADAAVS